MSFYYRPIIPLALAMIFGIVTGESVPGHRLVAWCMAVGSMLLLAFLIFRRKYGAITPMVLFAALGYLLIQPWTDPVFPPQHIRHAATGDKSIVTGVVATSPVTTRYRQSFIIETEALGGSTSRTEANGRLRVSLSGKEPELSAGDRISFVGRIRPIRSFQNPGGFDYNRYMAFKGVWATASGQVDTVRVLDNSVPVGLAVWVSPARKSVAVRIDGTVSGDAAGILKALLLGDRSGVSDQLRSDFQRAGIGHLLAISGLHVGMVAGVMFFVCWKSFGHVPVMLRRAWSKKAATIPAFMAVLGYGLLAGMSPSTQRAVIMAGVFLAAFLVERPQDTMNSVAVAACLILIVHPPSLFAASFQLSFAAVTAIVLGLSLKPAPGTGAPAMGAKPPLFHRICVFMLVSLAAILGTLPLALFYFNETSLIGLVSNLIFIPVIGFGVVPLGLASVVVCPVSPGIACLGFKLCGMLLTGAFYLVRQAASLPFAAVNTVTPSIIEIVLYYCLLGSGGWLASQGKRPASGRKTFGAHRIASMVLAASVAGFVADGIYWGYQRFWTDRMKITIIDVGHGNASLVEIPGGEVILIDGGGFSDNSVYDVGQRIVAPFLWRKKIRTVQTLILSHPDSDHLNGLIYIAEHFHVTRLVTSGQSADTRGYEKLMAVARTEGIEVPDYGLIDRTWSKNGVVFEILYPAPGFLDRRDMETWQNENNNSLVVKTAFKEVSFLFPGDIEAAGERALVGVAGRDLQTRVLISPHHGSRSSSTREFLGNVSPEIIVVSSGFNDRYGVPHPEVNERYNQLGPQVYTTPEHGAVTFITDGDKLWVETVVE
jgi:competence protein ComEC